MPQDTRLGQDSPATALAPSLPQRITRSRAHALGAEHQLVSLFLISVESFSIKGGGGRGKAIPLAYF